MSASRLIGSFGPAERAEPLPEALESMERFEARMEALEFREAALGWSKDMRAFCSEWLNENKNSFADDREKHALAASTMESFWSQIAPWAPRLAALALFGN